MPELVSETEMLKALIAEGLASGVCDKEPEAIIEEIIAKRRTHHDAKGNIMQVTAVLTHAEEGGYIAHNPETGTVSQGETVEEALANLREAVELYLEEFPMTFHGAPLVTTFDVLAHA